VGAEAWSDEDLLWSVRVQAGEGKASKEKNLKKTAFNNASREHKSSAFRFPHFSMRFF